jgi:hypothetical protein
LLLLGHCGRSKTTEGCLGNLHLHPWSAVRKEARWNTQRAGENRDGVGSRLDLAAFVLPDGAVIPVGGKTGTGDNRFKTFAPGGALISQRVVNRTATFVFILGDRYYGTVTAFVPGADAAGYRFTSALAVQVLKDLSPQLLPLISGS